MKRIRDIREGYFSRMAVDKSDDEYLKKNKPNEPTTLSKALDKKDQKKLNTTLAGKQTEPNRGQGASRRPSVPHAHVTGPTNEENMIEDYRKLAKEDAPAMSSGAAGDPGHVQNATDNYASQKAKKKSVKSLMRRKKPV